MITRITPEFLSKLERQCKNPSHTSYSFEGSFKSRMFKCDEILSLLSEIKSLREKNGVMKDELKYYANEKNYISIGPQWDSHLPILKEGGIRAREALRKVALAEIEKIRSGK